MIQGQSAVATNRQSGGTGVDHRRTDEEREIPSRPLSLRDVRAGRLREVLELRIDGDGARSEGGVRRTDVRVTNRRGAIGQDLFGVDVGAVRRDVAVNDRVVDVQDVVRPDAAAILSRHVARDGRVDEVDAPVAIFGDHVDSVDLSVNARALLSRIAKNRRVDEGRACVCADAAAVVLRGVARNRRILNVEVAAVVETAVVLRGVVRNRRTDHRHVARVVHAAAVRRDVVVDRDVRQRQLSVVDQTAADVVRIVRTRRVDVVAARNRDIFETDDDIFVLGADGDDRTDEARSVEGQAVFGDDRHAVVNLKRTQERDVLDARVDVNDAHAHANGVVDRFAQRDLVVGIAVNILFRRNGDRRFFERILVRADINRAERVADASLAVVIVFESLRFRRVERVGVATGVNRGRIRFDSNIDGACVGERAVLEDRSVHEARVARLGRSHRRKLANSGGRSKERVVEVRRFRGVQVGALRRVVGSENRVVQIRRALRVDAAADVGGVSRDGGVSHLESAGRVNRAARLSGGVLPHERVGDARDGSGIAVDRAALRRRDVSFEVGGRRVEGTGVIDRAAVRRAVARESRAFEGRDRVGVVVERAAVFRRRISFESRAVKSREGTAVIDRAAILGAVAREG